MNQSLFRYYVLNYSFDTLFCLLLPSINRMFNIKTKDCERKNHTHKQRAS